MRVYRYLLSLILAASSGAAIPALAAAPSPCPHVPSSPCPRKPLVPLSPKAPCRLVASSPEAPAAKIEWIKKIGGCTLMKWKGLDPEQPQETIVIRDGKNRTIVRISDEMANLDYQEDLTADGVPDVILSTFTGGAHCCEVHYVYALGPNPRCLLVYNMGNVGEFKPASLGEKRTRSILASYDGFAYFYGPYAFSPVLPMVLGYRNGRYIDVSTSFPQAFAKDRSEAEKRLREALRQAHGRRLPAYDSEAFSDAVEYYIILRLTGSRLSAQQKLFSILPDIDHLLFLHRRTEIERILCERSARFLYPPAYSTFKVVYGD